MNTSRLLNRPAPDLRAGVVLSLLVTVLGTAGDTQSARAQGVSVDAAKRAEIVDSVTAAIDRIYVFPDVAEEMERHVRGRLAQGAYDDLTTVDALAQALTRDLRSISHDRHLTVRYASPELIAMMSADRDPAEVERERRENYARTNYQFKRIEILPNNVGYMRFDAFVDAGYAGPTAIAAMNFLANCDALIIDLRYNGGGSPSLIQLITSYFFDEPVHLNSFYIRRTDSIRQFWTQANVEGPRMTESDIYILTSDRTFSGAEEFTYNLKNLERATIIGDTTGGGAHPTSRVLFANLNVGASVPFGRAINPITGTNWEGTGVIPHVVVPSNQALETAQLMALRKMREGETHEGRRFSIDWAIAGVEAKLNPVTVAPAILESYAGWYGPRQLRFENGELWYQRVGRPRMRAVPMSDHLFRFDELDYFRLEVVTDASGQPVKLVGHYDNGTTDESLRSGGS